MAIMLQLTMLQSKASLLLKGLLKMVENKACLLLAMVGRVQHRGYGLWSLWAEEESLMLYALWQAFLLMAITGLGYLALTWSTVVLLGGFVSTLGKKDFWCLTAISMIQAARSVNLHP
jgi:hypothetical protein